MDAAAPGVVCSGFSGLFVHTDYPHTLRVSNALYAAPHSICSGFSGQLPEAVPLSLAVLHGAAGARLLPWLSSISSLDEETCEVRAAGWY